jgi:hypothetical protein
MHGNPAFCLAQGSLDEVCAWLPKASSWQALSVTIPPHILKVVDEKLSLASSCCLIQLSINRPNITYATHTLVGGTNNFHNLDCIIPQPFHPLMHLPKLLIVHDNKMEVKSASNHLNDFLWNFKDWVSVNTITVTCPLNTLRTLQILLVTHLLSMGHWLQGQ